jgi:serine/threonine protein kinase
MRRVKRDEDLVVGPLSNGRFVKENHETITIIYPLREFNREQGTEFHEMLQREIATLEALKMNVGGSFPEGYTLSKSVDAIAIELKNPGTTLRSLINNKTDLTKHGLNIFRLLFRAISRLSFRGYAHRDINPENILVSSDFKELQLIGFGRSCHKERETEKLSYLPRPYLDPEYEWWP